MNNKKIKYLTAVAVATTFHLSAIIFLLALPMSKIKFSLLNSAKFLAATCLIALFFSEILSFILGFLPTYYSHYAVGSEYFASNNLGNYIDVLIKTSFFLLTIFCGYTKKIDEFAYDTKVARTTNIYMNFMVVSICIAIISIKASLLDRLIHYFWIFQIFSIANMISEQKNMNRYITYLGVAASTMLYNISLLILRPEWNRIVPFLFLKRST